MLLVPEFPRYRLYTCLKGLFALLAVVSVLVLPGEARELRKGDTPSLGNNNVLAILVDYSDTQPMFSQEDYTSHLFGNGTNSFADFYAAASDGKLTLRAGPAGVLGWYKLAMTREQAHESMNEMVFLAVQRADREGVDFAAYDNDGDCDTDTLIIVRQGESGPFWASNIGGYGPYVTRSPCKKGGFVTVHNYITLAERMGNRPFPVGWYAHEYGHVLGIGDLYDTDGSSWGIGQWGNMGGSDGLPDAWSRYVLGWLTPIKIQAGAAPVTITLPPASESPSAVLFGSGELGSEYFLVENRQRTGLDTEPKGTGLIVWHIDESVTTYNNKECAPRLPGQCALEHYKVAVVQADGKWDLEKRDEAAPNDGDDGDPFPGSKGVTSINDDTNPSVRFYSGARSGISITAITQSGKNVSALMSQELLPQDLYFYLRYSKVGSGKGDIGMSPSGIPPACGATSCTIEYNKGTKVTLTATPAPGSDFKGWSGAGCSGTGSCTVTMSSDQQVTATFEARKPFKLFSGAYGSGEGRVVMSPAGASSTCDESKICETLFG